MAEIHPNDIGLATFADVGDVSELRTAAKTIVSAINELCNANGVTPILGEQVYVDGNNNVIIGTGNVVKGSNNLIVGSDNLVISDGAIVFKHGIRLYLENSFSLVDYNADQRKIVYDYGQVVPTFVIGDKIAFKIKQTWSDRNYQSSVTKALPFQVCTVVEVNESEHYLIVDKIEDDTASPDEVHTVLEFKWISESTILDDSVKYVCGENAMVFGGTAKGKNSAAINVSSAQGEKSFSANEGSADGYSSAAFNLGQSEGEYSFSANLSEVHGKCGAAFGEYNRNFSPFSFVAGAYSRVLGRKMKCEALNISDNSITIEPGEDISGIAQYTKILIRYHIGIGTGEVYDTYTVDSVNGRVLNFTSDKRLFNGQILFPDKSVFVAEPIDFGNTSANFVTGETCIGAGHHVFTSGMGVQAMGRGCAIFGKYGTNLEDYSIALGNGTNMTLPGLAFKVKLNGDVAADGEYTSPCADYAEFFEWEDGNPENEDRAGYFVKLEGDKISKCNDFDKPLGIISATPAIVGDSSELRWQGKFITDDFGRIQYHDVVIPETLDNDGNVISKEHIERQPVLNPEWDPETEYIPRKDRPEWGMVGVLGKLVVFDDGTLQAGDACRCGDNGIAVKSVNNGYPVLKRISADKVLIWFRG